MQVVDQLCNEFEREVSQMTQEMGFLKLFCFFFGWEMDIESQADAIVSHWWANGSILGTSAAGYCEVPWRTCTLC